MGGLVPAADCGVRRACLWVGQRTLSRTHGRERMDGAQMGVASDWVGLSLRGFWVSAGVSVGESRPRILSANKRMDDVQMAVASEWAGLSLRRIMGFGGRVRGGKKG